MKISYDKEVDAKYIHFKKGEVSKTVKEQDGVFIDYDKKGSVLGVEILNASKSLISVFSQGGIFAGLGNVKHSFGLKKGYPSTTIQSVSNRDSLVIV